MIGKLEAVKRIRGIDVESGIDECILTIGLDSIYAYYPYNRLMSFLNQEVSYVTRIDMVNGQKQQVLCDITEVSHVQTVETTENVKLYTKDNKRPYCNFALRTLKFGEWYPQSIAYMYDFTEGASKYAHWFDCNCLDSESKVFVLRVFAKAEEGDIDQRESLKGMCGSYVQFDLRLTRFGYQCEGIKKLDWKGGETSPEVYLAKEILVKELDKDPVLRDFINQFDLIGALTTKMDGEPGYQLVRMASELYFVNAMDNITGDVDIKAMRRAVYCSRFYMMATSEKYSRSVFNVNRVLRSPELKKDTELLHILDVLSGKVPSATKIMYVRIRQLVDTVIQIRRGEEYEKDFINNSINAVSQFGGLL